MKITQNAPYKYISVNISSRFFKTNLRKCAVIWVKKSKKGRFRKAEKLHIDSNKGIKGKEKKKERGDGKEKRKKQ